MNFTNKFYDGLKSFAMIHLPALGTFYFAIASIWGLPFPQRVVGSIIALDTFLGIGLKVSDRSYKPSADGHLVVDSTNPAKDVYNLVLNTPLEELPGKKSITLLVGGSGNDQKTT